MQGEKEIDIFCVLVFFWDMCAAERKKKPTQHYLLKGYDEDSVHFSRK